MKIEDLKIGHMYQIKYDDGAPDTSFEGVAVFLQSDPQSYDKGTLEFLCLLSGEESEKGYFGIEDVVGAYNPIENIQIVSTHLAGTAKILVNLKDRWGTRIVVNSREYKDEKLTIAVSFQHADKESPIFEYTFDHVPTSIGNIIANGLEFNGQNKDQQYLLFMRQPKSNEELASCSNIISAGILMKTIE